MAEAKLISSWAGLKTKPNLRDIFCSQSCFGSGSYLACNLEELSVAHGTTVPFGSAVEAPDQPLQQHHRLIHCSSQCAVTCLAQCAPSYFFIAQESHQGPLMRAQGLIHAVQVPKMTRAQAASNSHPSRMGACCQGKGSSYKYWKAIF